VNHDDAFRRRADVLWRRSLDAVVLFPGRAEHPITVAGTGVDVWELLDTWRTVDALAELLALRYDAEAPVVEADITALIGKLSDAGALEWAADGGATTSR
jgi:hypothetical protein